MRDYVEMLVDTGARPGKELMNLKWKQIKFAMNPVEIRTGEKTILDDGTEEEVTNAQLSQFISRLQDENLQPSSIKHYLVVLRTIFKYAIANDLMQSHPLFPKVSGRLRT